MLQSKDILSEYKPVELVVPVESSNPTHIPAFPITLENQVISSLDINGKCKRVSNLPFESLLYRWIKNNLPELTSTFPNLPSITLY